MAASAKTQALSRSDRGALLAATVACIALLVGFFSAASGENPECGHRNRQAASTDDVSVRFITKNIEDLVPGEQVLAWNEETGEQALKPIEETFRRESNHLRVVRIENFDGERQTLRTTDEHPFWTENRGWVEAGELTLEDALREARGRPVRVVSTHREDLPEPVPVFNMEVADWHTYFVTQTNEHTGLVVHNYPKPIDPSRLIQGHLPSTTLEQALKGTGNIAAIQRNENIVGIDVKTLLTMTLEEIQKQLTKKQWDTLKKHLGRPGKELRHGT
jgi:hypothetical protein